MASPLKLADFGENCVVERLTALLPPMPPSVLTGPGDDCAVIEMAPGQPLTLLKADSVIEGIHFVPDEQMQRVGWKALCRAISDIAAMGGRPLHALVALAAPPETPWQRVADLYKGLRGAAETFQVSIVGGETCHTAGPLVCSIFLTGSVPAEHCVLRSGGYPGDFVLVTGRLGGSLESGRHLDFSPRLEEGQWLAQRGCVHAMMDLSDGIAVDGPRLAKASQCGLSIDINAIPCHEGCGITQAVSDGEDFELLLAISPDDLESLLHDWRVAFPQLPLSVVGRLTKAEDGMQPAEIFENRGYDHFQQS